jgi:hypothetical protein
MEHPQEAVASLRLLAAPGGAWHGSLRITEPRSLSIGARCPVPALP